MAALAPLTPPRPVAPTVVGIVESVGQLGERELFIGGWTNEKPAPGSMVAVIVASGLIEARWWAARTDRPDVGPGAGFCAMLQLSADLAADDVLAVQLGANQVLRLYERRQLLDERQSTAQLRAGMARATQLGDQPLLLEAAARYDGTDTISGSALPIRVGIDDCVALGDATILLSGWLFDPEQLVRQVTLAGTPISDRWITRARPDVLDNLGGDPRFSAISSTSPYCGFTALVAAGAGDGLHLTLTTDEQRLHLPLRARRGNAPTLLASLLRGLDPDLPSSLDVVDRLVAPVLARLAPSPLRLSSDLTDFDPDAELSLVVGCHGDVADIGAVLAALAVDASTRNLPVIVAAPARELAAHAGAIERSARHFGMQVALAGGEGIVDHIDALALGAMASKARNVCLLAADAVPQSAGWLQILREAAGAGGTLVVPATFDHAGYGHQAYQKERSRLLPGVDCCLVPRHELVHAHGELEICLSRGHKGRALLERLVGTLDRIDVPAVEVLVAAEPVGALSERADHKAALLRAALT